MKQPQTSAKQIETAERRAAILDLRKAGSDYRQIAKDIIKHFGVDNLPKGFDERYAWMDVKRELERLNTERREDTLEIRTLELERLDRLLMSFYPKAIKGDYQAADRVLKIMAQREKYIAGLAVPQKIDIDVSNWRRQVVAGLLDKSILPETVKLNFDPATALDLFREAGIPVTEDAA